MSLGLNSFSVIWADDDDSRDFDEWILLFATVGWFLFFVFALLFSLSREWEMSPRAKLIQIFHGQSWGKDCIRRFAQKRSMQQCYVWLKLKRYLNEVLDELQYDSMSTIYYRLVDVVTKLIYLRLQSCTEHKRQENYTWSQQNRCTSSISMNERNKREKAAVKHETRRDANKRSFDASPCDEQGACQPHLKINTKKCVIITDAETTQRERCSSPFGSLSYHHCIKRDATR